jgi:peptidoglycan-N-acetylglucosamine deacetylase
LTIPANNGRKPASEEGMRKHIVMLFMAVGVSLWLTESWSQAQNAPATRFKWPAGKHAALSLSFDDARASQPDGGAALLDRLGLKATFFVNPGPLPKQLAGWKKIVAAGHEIGNHSVTHPCSGNFAWSRNKALEDLTLDKLREDFTTANQQIKDLLGVTAETFAYPCGQKFVGRGMDTRSYVPLVASMFLLGRGYNDEAAADPLYCDFAQLPGVNGDNKTFEELLPLIEQTRKEGTWLIFAGHEIGTSGNQTTRITTLEKLAAYVNNPANEIWVAPMSTVAKYIHQQRAVMNK